MSAPRKVIIIAKERPFDEEKWKRLLTAFAYVLHERHTAQRGNAHPDDSCHAAYTRDAP